MHTVTKHIFVRLSVLTKNKDIQNIQYVYCILLRLLLYHKGDQCRQQWTVLLPGMEFQEPVLPKMFFDFFLTYGNNQFREKKDETSLQVLKSFSIISESPFSTFYVRSDISNDENKMVSHHFQIHENTALDNVLKTDQLL